jgi:hypothetical protein
MKREKIHRNEDREIEITKSHRWALLTSSKGRELGPCSRRLITNKNEILI